jgi:hypothetical protein
LQKGVTVLKSRVQARSQVEQLRKSALAQRFIGEIESSDVIDWLRGRGASKVRRKKRDGDGRIVRVKEGRRLVVQFEEIRIGEKTVLNELMRLSAVFVFARVELGMQGLPKSMTTALARRIAAMRGCLETPDWVLNFSKSMESKEKLFPPGNLRCGRPRPERGTTATICAMAAI